MAVGPLKVFICKALCLKVLIGLSVVGENGRHNLCHICSKEGKALFVLPPDGCAAVEELREAVATHARKFSGKHCCLPLEERLCGSDAPGGHALLHYLCACQYYLHSL